MCIRKGLGILVAFWKRRKPTETDQKRHEATQNRLGIDGAMRVWRSVSGIEAWACLVVASSESADMRHPLL